MQSKFNQITFPDLKDTEKLLIWSTREWIISIMRAKDPKPKIIKCFSEIFIQEAVMPFDKMMRTIGYNCSVPIDVRCHCSNLLGRTEIDILCLISIIQNNFQFDLKKIIKVSNKDYHLEVVKHSFKLVESLNRAKITIPVRNEFLNKYNINKYKINDNVVYYDFKNKLKRKCT
tara:strand:+ start:334 stop:852 length:519 start_codon:yes stop_codon:yes gene_type:complete